MLEEGTGPLLTDLHNAICCKLERLQTELNGRGQDLTPLDGDVNDASEAVCDSSEDASPKQQDDASPTSSTTADTSHNESLKISDVSQASTADTSQNESLRKSDVSEDGGLDSALDDSLEWSVLGLQDAEALFVAQNQLVLEHQELARPHCTCTFEDWKKVVGYPLDDARRLEFNRNVPTASTKHGDRLHCLRLMCCRKGKAITAGFVDFEVRPGADALCGAVRQIYIRSLVVPPNMRRRGYGTALFNAMLEYLGPGELDIISLTVMDMNRAAMNLYFQLGFKITRWFLQRVGGEHGFEVVFLHMQKLQGTRLNSGTPGAIAMSLQEMPHLFAEYIVGEIVNYACESDPCAEPQRFLLSEYDAKSRRFVLVKIMDEPDKAERAYLPYNFRERQQVVRDICVNDSYSRGVLTFNRAPSIQIQGRSLSLPSPASSSSQSIGKVDGGISCSSKRGKCWMQTPEVEKDAKEADNAREMVNAAQVLQEGNQSDVRNLCKPWGVQLRVQKRYRPMETIKQELSMAITKRALKLKNATESASAEFRCDAPAPKPRVPWPSPALQKEVDTEDERRRITRKRAPWPSSALPAGKGPPKRSRANSADSDAVVRQSTLDELGFAPTLD